MKRHGIPGYWENADFEKAYGLLASHASHSTWNSWAQESIGGSYRVFTWLTPWKAAWIPLFTFSLSTPATREVVHVGGNPPVFTSPSLDERALGKRLPNLQQEAKETHRKRSQWEERAF